MASAPLTPTMPPRMPTSTPLPARKPNPVTLEAPTKRPRSSAGASSCTTVWPEDSDQMSANPASSSMGSEIRYSRETAKISRQAA